MKLQFFSDLHLEFGPVSPVRTDADVIIAAGDVDVGEAGVRWLREIDKPVIYVAGNHEYYGGEMHEVQRAIRGAVADSNIHFLEQESVVIDGVRFLGATLWTDFMGANDELMSVLREHMNDYQQIRFGERMLEPADLVTINQATREWLAHQLGTAFSGKTVVVTHHAPLYASWHQDAKSIFKGAYCNNLSRMVLDHNIDLWVHGHVHARADYRANDLRVVCNPRGYDGYQLVHGFSTARTVEV